MNDDNVSTENAHDQHKFTHLQAKVVQTSCFMGPNSARYFELVRNPPTLGVKMLEPHSNETQTRWDAGEFQVMVMSPTMAAPIGFCEGTASDESEILATAEGEGVEVVIEKKILKTGREIWTVSAVCEI